MRSKVTVKECPIDHPALADLFDCHIPDNPVLWSVLKGYHTGKALVNNLQRPTECVVRTNARLTFASHRISDSFLMRAITRFRQEGAVWLVCPSAIPSLFQVPAFTRVIQRLEFYDYDPSSIVLDDLRRMLPRGFTIHPIDRRLLERCEWRDEIEFYCDGLDNFLVSEFGVCMMQGENIIVEAYVSSFGEAQCEIGAFTHLAYRGHGYAPITCAYLIEACERRGYHAYWSCDTENVASIRVARKLGFHQERAYQILEYEALA